MRRLKYIGDLLNLPGIRDLLNMIFPVSDNSNNNNNNSNSKSNDNNNSDSTI